MSIYEKEALRLIDAIPIPGDRHELQVEGSCPLAFDASGTRNAVFEAAAEHPDVARQLYLGKRSIDNSTLSEIGRRAHFNSPVRVQEHVECLLNRAMGLCAAYDPEFNRERTQDEAVAFIRSQKHA